MFAQRKNLCFCLQGYPLTSATPVLFHLHTCLFCAVTAMQKISTLMEDCLQEPLELGDVSFVWVLFGGNGVFAVTGGEMVD